MHHELIEAGEVWLVGAGPGDPGLLTRKAEQLLRAATIVFHDALVGPGVLDLIPPSARRVYVGKRSGRHSRHQDTISAMLLRAAKAGERVVRLKGGDPSIFGRAAEELDVLRDHGVRVRICPGVTAASAAAASAGISLTLRGVARKLVFVTASVNNGAAPVFDCATLSDPEATLAIYMGKGAATRISRGLMDAGLRADTPVLIVENASLENERLFATPLNLLPIAAAAMESGGPMILLVGEAVRMPSEPGESASATILTAEAAQVG